MTITNGYCTLAQLKQRLKDMRTYTASTISFTESSKTITDTAYGLGRFTVGDIIAISGSTSNNGYFTIVTAPNSTPNIITVSESLTDEVAGDSVTISQQVSLKGGVDPDDDIQLEENIEEASRYIDDITHMTFYANTETRKYIVGEDTDGLTLWLDKPLLSVTTLTNGDNIVLTAGTDYVLLELNDPPYHKVKLTSSGGKTWNYIDDIYTDTIDIAGTWGNYSTVPRPIRLACLMLAARFWKRKDAIFGVSGSTQLGQLNMQIPEDRDIYNLLSPYIMPIGYSYGK